MGDICLSNEVTFLNNIADSVTPFFQVAEQCLTPDTEDEDMNELKWKLREALLDAFSSVSFCISQMAHNDIS